MYKVCVPCTLYTKCTTHHIYSFFTIFSSFFFRYHLQFVLLTCFIVMSQEKDGAEWNLNEMNALYYYHNMWYEMDTHIFILCPLCMYNVQSTTLCALCFKCVQNIYNIKGDTHMKWIWSRGAQVVVKLIFEKVRTIHKSEFMVASLNDIVIFVPCFWRYMYDVNIN